jgi:hypothetical protein
MDESERQLQTLIELDARHDELLKNLEELDRRLTQVLSQWTACRDQPTQAVSAGGVDD